MSLVLYNTYSKKEEPFETLEPKKVKMYTCGPTVYGRPHIGNYSSFLMADLLRRWLEVNEYQVTHVKNITDVGHLAADRDQGEDKVEKQAREEFGSVTHESVIAIARKYEEQYLGDEKTLKFLEPAHRPRATDYIEQMKKMIDVLLEKGSAYVTDDGIYFDVTSFAEYGTLSGNTVENLSAGARVFVNESKKNPSDFALWKFCVGPNELHALRWPSPGVGHPEGFPGWHIECSAMIGAILGRKIDIHTGGEDNIFPHHECEIAQSESVTGEKPFSRFWLHKRRIDMGDQKMSKSLGNVLTLPDILAKGYDAMDLRYYLLSVHYRTNLKFSWKGMDDAKKARHRIMEWMEEVQKNLSTQQRVSVPAASAPNAQVFQKNFADAMNADLNTPAAIAVIFDAATTYRRSPDSSQSKAYEEFILQVRQTFGCFDPEQKSALPSDIITLRDQRAEARAKKDFAESDRLRKEIEDLGYSIKDTSEGQKVEKR